MLDVCRTLLDEAPDALFTSHVNESPGEIAFVRELFPDARDYIDTYERAGLLRECSVLAHNVHVSDDELHGSRQTDTAVAHCPSLERLPGLRDLPDGAPRRGTACASGWAPTSARAPA